MDIEIADKTNISHNFPIYDNLNSINHSNNNNNTNNKNDVSNEINLLARIKKSIFGLNLSNSKKIKILLQVYLLYVKANYLMIWLNSREEI